MQIAFMGGVKHLNCSPPAFPTSQTVGRFPQPHVLQGRRTQPQNNGSPGAKQQLCGVCSICVKDQDNLKPQGMSVKWILLGCYILLIDGGLPLTSYEKICVSSNPEKRVL